MWSTLAAPSLCWGSSHQGSTSPVRGMLAVNSPQGQNHSRHGDSKKCFVFGACNTFSPRRRTAVFASWSILVMLSCGDQSARIGLKPAAAFVVETGRLFGSPPGLLACFLRCAHMARSLLLCGAPSWLIAGFNAVG